MVYVKNILALVNDAKDVINNLEITPHGHLALGIHGALNTAQFTKALTFFLQLYPKISLEVTINNSPYRLLNNEVDLTISEEIIHEKQLIKEPLLPLQRKIYASPFYLKKHGTPKTLKDLNKHNCLIYKPLSVENAWVINNKKIALASNYITDSDRNFMHAAINGMGLAWSAELFVREEVKSGKLVEVKLKGTIKKSELFLFYRPTHSGSNIRLLIDHIKNFMNITKKKS